MRKRKYKPVLNCPICGTKLEEFINLAPRLYVDQCNKCQYQVILERWFGRVYLQRAVYKGRPESGRKIVIVKQEK